MTNGDFSAFHERQDTFCGKCGKKYEVRIKPGCWETVMCYCGCLLKYWDSKRKCYSGATFYPRKIAKSRFESAVEFENKVVESVRKEARKDVLPNP